MRASLVVLISPIMALCASGLLDAGAIAVVAAGLYLASIFPFLGAGSTGLLNR